MRSGVGSGIHDAIATVVNLVILVVCALVVPTAITWAIVWFANLFPGFLTTVWSLIPYLLVVVLWGCYVGGLVTWSIVDG